MHEFGAYAPNITGSAFLLELWNNALRCSREVLRSCAARLPPMTAKKNFMLNRYEIQRRITRSKKSGLSSDLPEFVVITRNDTLKIYM